MIRLQRKQFVLSVALAMGVDGAMAAAGWDCQRGADGKEWVCASGKSKPSKKADDGEISEPKPDSKQARPETSAPAVKPEPVEEPVRQAEPSRPVARQAEPPAKAELARPVREPSSDTLATAKQADKKKTEAQPVQKEAAREKERTGWNCRPGESEQWDCSLIGPDPRGEAHVVSEGGRVTADWAHSTTMTREDEQRFSSIMAHLPSNPWATSCAWNKTEYTPSSEFLLTPADENLRSHSPIEIHSDRAEMIHGEASNYLGSAELIRGDQKLFGNSVSHNKESGALNAQGNVIYMEKGLAFSSDISLMKLKSDEVVLRNSQFILETVPSRGVARVVHIDDKYKSRYETATYTTC
ncbi:MAG: hypothetical protein PHE55_02985, partial [Methylococcaceae bacterium]|nr:hypothetical protein [Methylococcaceae bacterium]